MIYLANTQQIREADRIQIEDYQYPGILLMETAGRLASETILRLYPEQQAYIILAGPGNNGGDGLVIARYLHLAGKRVRVFCSHAPDKYQGDAGINYDVLRHLPVELKLFEAEAAKETLSQSSQIPVLIDALLGTGIRSELRDPVKSIISSFQDLNLPVVAIDLPSGLSADTGKQINEVLTAQHTLTFQLPKICHYVTPAKKACGQVHVLDIGIWPSVIRQLGIRRQLLNDQFVRQHYRRRDSDAHKGSFGHVLIIGGSKNMSGAIAMAAYAAVKSGAGLCTVLSPGTCRQTIFNLAPEVMCLAPGGAKAEHLDEQAIPLFEQAIEGKTAIVMGPGMGLHPGTKALFQKILPMVRVPLLLDADALNLLAAHPKLWESLPASTLLTPHPGEMRRLDGRSDPVSKRLETAEQFARKKGAWLVLKGAGTIVACPDGKSYVNNNGNPGMATGGSGDVLSGIIGALLAQNYSPEIAAGIGVYLHGKAGDHALTASGQEGLSATDIIRSLGFLWAELLQA